MSKTHFWPVHGSVWVCRLLFAMPDLRSLFGKFSIAGIGKLLKVLNGQRPLNARKFKGSSAKTGRNPKLESPLQGKRKFAINEIFD